MIKAKFPTNEGFLMSEARIGVRKPRTGRKFAWKAGDVRLASLAGSIYV